jgi:glycerate-2-kinase
MRIDKELVVKELIKNKRELVKNGFTRGDRSARKIALDVLERVLEEADPRAAVKKSFKVENNSLIVGGEEFNLENFENIFVLGGGKAGGGMSEAVEEVLGTRISGGEVNIPEGTGERYKTRRVVLNEASHPVPNERGLIGAKNMIQISEDASNKDLIIALISGGASALLPLPAGDLTLADIQDLTNALLKSGAVIDDLNTVRKHISMIKGGGLARACHPATLIALIISDVVGDPLDVIASGPTVPDPSTFGDAVKVLKRYGLWDNFPKIKRHLERGLRGYVSETPKKGDTRFENVHNVLISTNKMVLTRALEGINRRYESSIISTGLIGEARVAGKRLVASIMKQKKLERTKSQVRVYLAGGETTVTVKGSGLGGRNQELVLASMSELKGDGVCLASLGSDGIDGSADAAGALADGRGLEKALDMGLSIKEFLDDNDSYHFFKQLGDLIITGPTGTNINDVAVFVITQGIDV